MLNRAGIPGVLYNFDTQNLINFEGNLKYKGDFSFVAYCDFETKAPTDCSPDPEITEMFPVSSVIIFAFHPDINLSRIIVERCLGHDLSRLANSKYLNRDILTFADSITMAQLQDYAIRVSQRTFKQTISEMFSTKIKFAGDCLMKWFDRRLKSENLSLSLDKKIRFAKEHPIDWENGKCCISNSPLKIKAK